MMKSAKTVKSELKQVTKTASTVPPKHSISPSSPTFTKFEIGKRNKIKVYFSNNGTKSARFKISSQSQTCFICIPAVSPLISPGMKFKFEILFQPSEKKEYREIFTIEGSDDSSFDFEVSSLVSTPSLDCKSCNLGYFSTNQCSTIEIAIDNMGNEGIAKLQFSSLSDWISLDDETNSSIQVQKQFVIPVKVFSLEHGHKHETLLVTYENGISEPLKISATFETPAILLEGEDVQLDSRIRLPNVNIGCKSALNFTLTNTSHIRIPFELESSSSIQIKPRRGNFEPLKKLLFHLEYTAKHVGKVQEYLVVKSEENFMKKIVIEVECVDINLSFDPPFISLPETISQNGSHVQMKLFHDCIQPMQYITETSCSNGTACLTPAIGTMYPSEPMHLVFSLNPKCEGQVQGNISLICGNDIKKIFLTFQTSVNHDIKRLNVSPSHVKKGILSAFQPHRFDLTLTNNQNEILEWWIYQEKYSEFLKFKFVKGFLKPGEKCKMECQLVASDEFLIDQFIEIHGKFETDDMSYIVALFKLEAEFEIPEIEVEPESLNLDVYENHVITTKIKIINKSSLPTFVKTLYCEENGISISFDDEVLEIEGKMEVWVSCHVKAKITEVTTVNPSFELLLSSDLKERYGFSLTCHPRPLSYEVEMVPFMEVFQETFRESVKTEMPLDDTLDFGSLTLNSIAARKILVKNSSNVIIEILLRSKDKIIQPQWNETNHGNHVLGFKSEEGIIYAQDLFAKETFEKSLNEKLASGTGFHLDFPSKLVLGPREEKSVEFKLYNNKLGHYENSIEISSQGLSSKVFSVFALVSGCPIKIDLEKPILKFNGGSKTFMVRNITPVPLIIRWKIYEITEFNQERPLIFQFDFWNFAKDGRIRSNISPSLQHEIEDYNEGSFKLVRGAETTVKAHEKQSIMIDYHGPCTQGILVGKILPILPLSEAKYWDPQDVYLDMIKFE